MSESFISRCIVYESRTILGGSDTFQPNGKIYACARYANVAILDVTLLLVNWRTMMTKKRMTKAVVKKQENTQELIWDAAIDGDWDAVKKWLQRDPSLISVTGFVKGIESALLHVALMHRLDMDFTKYLVELGADVNAEYDFGGLPLNMTYNVEMLKYLVSHGADVHATDCMGRTPLHYAAICNSNVNVLEFFIDEGVDVYEEDKMGKAPLDYAKTEEKKRLLRRAMTTE